MNRMKEYKIIRTLFFLRQRKLYSPLLTILADCGSVLIPEPRPFALLNLQREAKRPGIFSAAA